MRFLTWNIHHGGSAQRAPRIVNALVDHDPDVIILTEYRTKPGLDIPGRLQRAGWTYQASSNPSAKVNGLLVASRVPLQISPPPEDAPTPSERWLEVSLPQAGVSLNAVHVPNLNDQWGKRQYWEGVIRAARRHAGGKHLFMGDFNTGKAIDAEGTPFALAGFMDELEGLGWVDAWRSQHPGLREFTWYSAKCNGFRLDYAFLSPTLVPRLKNSQQLHGVREAGVSDHSPLMVELDF